MRSTAVSLSLLANLVHAGAAQKHPDVVLPSSWSMGSNRAHQISRDPASRKFSHGNLRLLCLVLKCFKDTWYANCRGSYQTPTSRPTCRSGTSGKSLETESVREAADIQSLRNFKYVLAEGERFEICVKRISEHRNQSFGSTTVCHPPSSCGTDWMMKA